MSRSQPNVILLSIDALRADHVSCYGYHRSTSPRLDAVADGGVRFEHAYSPSSHTREAVPALVTGRYPDQVTSGDFELTEPTVAAPLREAGYATGAFHSNPFISRGFGFDTDFDRFYDDLRVGRHRYLALAERALDKLFDRHYARAEDINRTSLEWIESLRDDRPFFLWNHYMDVHGPYEPPRSYQTEFRDGPVGRRRAKRLYRKAVSDAEEVTAAEHELLVDLYDAEIRYLDEQLGALLDELDRRSLLEETLVLITADHGDAFREHGYYEHPRRVHDELIHVPLLVSAPAVRSTTCDQFVSTLDVVPTVLGFAGEAAEGFPGASLFEQLRASERDASRLVFSQATGEGSDGGTVRFAARGDGERHYAGRDLDSHDLVQVSTEAGTERARSEIVAHSLERVRGIEPTDGDLDGVDSEVASRLEGLGYLE